MKVILSNSTLTVKLNDGSLLTTTDGTKELYYKILEAESDAQIKMMILGEIPDEEKKIIEHNKVVKKSKESAQNLCDTDPDFEILEGDVYMLGVSISIPKVLVEKFNSLLTPNSHEEYDALKNFWRWCALNSNPESREDLYTFIKKNDVKLTPKGNMILYRRIIKKGEGSDALVEFVSTSYVKVKKNKKSPAKYWVTSENNKYLLVHSAEGITPISVNEKIVGNLKDLYDNLASLSENMYTDAHTETMKIQVGEIYKISEDEVDLSNNKDCSRGLHCASRNYDYTGFGNTPVLVLVNPSKVRAVPTYSTGKMRVVEMFIASVLEIDNTGKYIDEDVNVLDLDDKYFNLAVDELNDLLETEGAKEDVGQGVLNIKELTWESANDILLDLKYVKNITAFRDVSY